MNEFNVKERTLARENILKVLYQHDINQYSFSDITKTFIEKRPFDKDHFNNSHYFYDIDCQQLL